MSMVAEPSAHMFPHQPVQFIQPAPPPSQSQQQSPQQAQQVPQTPNPHQHPQQPMQSLQPPPFGSAFPAYTISSSQAPMLLPQTSLGSMGMMPSFPMQGMQQYMPYMGPQSAPMMAPINMNSMNSMNMNMNMGMSPVNMAVLPPTGPNFGPVPMQSMSMQGPRILPAGGFPFMAPGGPQQYLMQHQHLMQQQTTGPQHQHPHQHQRSSSSSSSVQGQQQLPIQGIFPVGPASSAASIPASSEAMTDARRVSIAAVAKGGRRPLVCCDLCSKRFLGNQRLIWHRLVKHEDTKARMCDVCGGPYDAKEAEDFDRLRAVERGENPDDPAFSKKPFECKLCNAAFFRGDRLLAHSRMHTGEKPFQCDVCPRSFSRKDRLKAHRRSHTGEAPYECSVCRRAFTQATHLAKHMQMHSGDRHEGADSADGTKSESAGAAGPLLRIKEDVTESEGTESDTENEATEDEDPATK